MSTRLSAFTVPLLLPILSPLAPRSSRPITAHVPRPARHYVNLTNGLEALPPLSAHPTLQASELRFTRIQSSHAEASAYDTLLASLDNDLLFSLANAHTCYVYDLASRNPKRGVSRAHFLALPFIRFALASLWFGAESELLPKSVLVRGKNLVRYWSEEVLPYRIRKETKKRIRYYTPFAATSDLQYVDLRAVYGRSSVIDGRKDAHVEIAEYWLDSNFPGRDGEDENAGKIRQWMNEWRLSEFETVTESDDLRETQEWMQANDTRW